MSSERVVCDRRDCPYWHIGEEAPVSELFGKDRSRKKGHVLTALMILIVLAGTMLTAPVHGATSTAKCYTMTPSLTKAAFSYLNEVYTKKYPALALRLRYGTAEDKKNLKKLSAKITKGCDTDELKTRAVIDWCIANLTYDTQSSSYPAEVFYTRKAACLGYAALAADLLRIQGIPAVTGEGWRGDMKKLTHRQLYEEIAGHAWVYVRLGGKWVLFDPLFTETTPVTDRDYISRWYYTNTIEGVSVTYKGMNLSLLEGAAFVYQDGRFMNYFGGKVSAGNSNIGINDIRVPGSAYSSGCGYRYIDKARSTAGMKTGELFRDGWITYSDTTIEYAYENGVLASGTVMPYKGKDYYFTSGSTYRIRVPSGSYWLSGDRFCVAPGYKGRTIVPDSLDLREGDPDYRISYKMDRSFSTAGAAKLAKDGSLTAVSPGSVWIDYELVRIDDDAILSIGSFIITIANPRPAPDFSMKKRSVSEWNFSLTKSSYKYTGSAIKPSVQAEPQSYTEVNGKKPELRKGADYTVTYKNNVRAGTGTVTIKGIGMYAGQEKLTFTITGKQKDGKTRLTSGKTFTDQKSGMKYKVLKDNTTVKFVKTTGSAAALTIPASVKKDGVSYKVTAIAAGALKGNKTLTSLTIGKNVSKIGKKAFYNCRKLKKITISTKKLTSSSVGASAFAKVNKKASVRAPKGYAGKYRKLLRKKGLGKKASVK